MSFKFEFDDNNQVAILVIGVGGGGTNAVNHMIASGIKDVEYIAINTDKQALNGSIATNKLQVGEKLTQGLGAGSDPEVGRKAAEESEDKIREMLKSSNMCFIAAGMGGGTGTGGAPVIARIAKEMGILTVGVVTRPFPFEGKQRILQAQRGIETLKEQVDALVIIPNERLKYVSEQKITLQNAFAIADNVLYQSVKSLSEIMIKQGKVNQDFNDVVATMHDAGYAHIGVGRAEGKDKAIEATKMAIESPLLETSIKGAKGVLLNLIVCPDVGLEEVEEASSMVTEAAHPDAHIIFGVTIDDTLDNEVRVTVVATRFDAKPTVLPVAPAADSEAVPSAAHAQAVEPVAESVSATPAASADAAAGVKVGIQNPADFLRNASAPAGQTQTPTAENLAAPAPEEDDAFDLILRLFKDKA